MSEGTTLFMTLHYTDKVVYTCQEVILYLSPYTTLTRLYIYMSEGTTLCITLHYTDKIACTCQDVILYLSPYSTLTRLNIHVRRYYFIYHLTLH